MFSVNRNAGFSLALPNGWTVSVQFGGGNYCDHRSSRYDVSYLNGRGGSNWESETAEIAAFPTDNPDAKNWYSFGREEEGLQTYVEGYQKMEAVLDFINMIRALPMAVPDLSLDTARILADDAWWDEHMSEENLERARQENAVEYIQEAQ